MSLRASLGWCLDREEGQQEEGYQEEDDGRSVCDG